MKFIINFEDGYDIVTEGKTATEAVNSCLALEETHGEIYHVCKAIAVDGGYIEEEESDYNA